MQPLFLRTHDWTITPHCLLLITALTFVLAGADVAVAQINYDEATDGDISDMLPFDEFTLAAGINEWIGSIGPTPASEHDIWTAVVPADHGVARIRYTGPADDGGSSFAGFFEIEGPGGFLEEVRTGSFDETYGTPLVEGSYHMNVTSDFSPSPRPWTVKIDVVNLSGPSGWVINEIHADPDGTIAGDANGDGVRSSTADEFIEITNTTGSDQDISGWTLSDGFGVRHTFPGGTVVPDACAVVIFGGGTPTGPFGGAPVLTASTGALGLNNGGDTITLNDGSSDVATATYGSEGGDNQSLTLDPDVTGTLPYVKHTVATGSGGALYSPGRRIDGTAFSGCPQPPALVEIFEIQGSGDISPFEGDVVTTEDNVVTTLATNGFFMQTPTARTDGDSDTSDGIFVFTGGAPGVAVGDIVDVTGEVIEFFGLTEFSNSPVVSNDGPGGTVPAPVIFDGFTPSPNPTTPSCSASNFECFESMLVQVFGASVTGPNQRFGLDPIAEVYVTAGPTRAFRETGIEYPGLPGLPVWDGNPEVFELDPDRLGLPNQIIPAGSSFDAQGVVGFEFGGYELWPSQLTVFPASLPVGVRDRNTGEATIGSLELFRLFDDVDDPPSTDAQGGTRDDAVVSTAEYQRRRTKFARYIVEILGAPDILAVQEAEKIEVLQDLAADILALDASVSYTAYLLEGNDIGTIDVGFLVRDNVQVDAVTQLGKGETFIDPTDGSIDLVHDRPPLLLEGSFIVGSIPSFPIAVLGVHNRSLSGIGHAADGPRVRQKRLEQAQSIAQKVDDFQTANPAVGLVVAGDFNAYQFTDGYVDVVGQISGSFNPSDNLLSGPDLVDPDLTNQVSSLPPGEQYSFIFRGNGQVLDHMLTSSALNAAVGGLAYGRGNADAAVDLINDASTPLRSSDHDGLVLFVIVNEAPVIASADPAEQSVQYSDSVEVVTITATDSGPADLTLASTWKKDSGSVEASSLPGDLEITPSDPAAACGPAAGGGVACTWTLKGQMLESAGLIEIDVTVGDGERFSESATVTITVTPEDVTVAFDASNPIGVEVDAPGGDSPAFNLSVDVSEFDDPLGLAGDIDLTAVTVRLAPVGPGTPTQYPSETCTRTITPGTADGGGSPDNYDILTIDCPFTDVPVNTYAVEVDVNEDGYYKGAGEDVLVVYDPSLGFTTGGGWFYWPGTANSGMDYEGDKTNFGFNAKYNKKGTKAQGSLLLIRHQADGTFFRVKSNAMQGLSVGEGSDADGDFGWASFFGKATYKEPMWTDPVGNHQFTTYVEDRGTPGGGVDRFWIEVKDGDGLMTILALPLPATANAEPLQQGNIVVPQGKGRGKPGKFEDEIPDEFALHPNYPNPFNPATTITLDVPEESEVSLRVYDVLGRLVRVLLDGTKTPGVHRINFEAGRLPSGLYIIVADTPVGTFTRTMMLIG